MEEKTNKKRVSVITILLSTLVILVLAAVIVIYFYKYIPGLNNKENVNNTQNNSTQNTNNNNNSNNKTENTITILAVDDELVTKAHSYIPTVTYNDFLPTAYQTSKITFNDLPNKVKLINVFNKINFNKEKVKIVDGEEESEDILANWFSFDPEIMHKYAKNIYGQDAYIKDESFDIYYGCGCFYEKGKYSYSYGGGGSSLIPITYITKAFIDEENLYIYDKFLVAKEVVEINDLYGDEYYVYNNTVSNPIDKIVDEKLAALNSPDFEQFFLEKYKDKMTTYKHTFKKDASGNYYWYSSEPVTE